MIRAAHVVPYSKNAVADREFFRDVLQYPMVEMAARGVACSPVQAERWGLITRLTLPGGGTLGGYASRHPSPLTLGS